MKDGFANVMTIRFGETIFTYTINGNKWVVLEYANNGDKRCGFNLTGTPLKAQKDQFVPVFSIIV